MHAEILSGLVITRVFLVSTMWTLENTRQKKKDRSRWAVVMKYEGRTLYTCGEKTFLSDSSHITILPKGCSYDWECEKSGNFFIVEFDSPSTWHEPLTFSVKHGDRFLKLFRELESKWNPGGTLNQMETIRDLYGLLLELIHSGEDPYVPEGTQQKLLPAMEYISRNFNCHIRNDTLSAICGMSTVYFRKLFTATMGISPIAYARSLRIEKARQMLRSDYGNLSDLAQSLGYANLYDFSRDFKKHTGLAPSHYAGR